jgi:heptosyltransferase-1
MRILLIKISSMGDVIHVLPALTDAQQKIDNLQVDWVIDESFAPIACWHPAVHRVIMSSHRKWKKNTIRSLIQGDITRFYRQLRQQSYDYVIDAQSSIKSALIALCAKGKRAGLGKGYAREPMAHWIYHQKYVVPHAMHAVDRLRNLFCQILGYQYPRTPVNFNIQTSLLKKPTFALPKNYYVLIHATSWPTKHWPISSWRELLKALEQKKTTVFLPWHTDIEKQRARQICYGYNFAKILPRLGLSSLGYILQYATACISVDTGLGHISAALNTPTLSLYGPTFPEYIGTIGPKVLHIKPTISCGPCRKKRCIQTDNSQASYCLTTLSASHVLEKLELLLRL